MQDDGLFGPESVAWRLHTNRSLLVGGIRALLIQALDPRAMAAVSDHSDFRRDPWGRFRRTSQYIVSTVFGDTATAHAAAARVKAVHRRVQGIDPVTGRSYRADEPELLLWVHAAEVDSFLTAYRVYGGRLSDEDADRYVAEMVRVASLVGLPEADVPASVQELRAYFETRKGLCVTEASREALRLVLAPPLPLALRPAYAVLAAAAVAILPPKARELYGLWWPAPAGLLIGPAVRVLIGALDLTVPRPPEMRRALDQRRRGHAGSRDEPQSVPATGADAVAAVSRRG